MKPNSTRKILHVNVEVRVISPCVKILSAMVAFREFEKEDTFTEAVGNRNLLSSLNFAKDKEDTSFFGA